MNIRTKLLIATSIAAVSFSAASFAETPVTTKTTEVKKEITTEVKKDGEVKTDTKKIKEVKKEKEVKKDEVKKEVAPAATH